MQINTKILLTHKCIAHLSYSCDANCWVTLQLSDEGGRSQVKGGGSWESGVLSRSGRKRKEHLPWVPFAASISSTLVVAFLATNNST